MAQSEGKPKSRYKIIESGDSQAEVNAAVRAAGGRADSTRKDEDLMVRHGSTSIEDCTQRFDEAIEKIHALDKRIDDCSSYIDSRKDDRSSEEHGLEAERLEKMAEMEKEPEVKKMLERKALFHREEIGL
jgi:hypothetical protein